MPERELVCAGYRCPIQFGPEPARLAITPDGATAYYSGFPDGIAVLRAGSGSLVPLPGRWGCIVRRRPFAPWPHCVRAGQPIGSDMSVSPDGRNLYVATSGTGRNGLAFSGGIEAFKIQR